MNQRAWIFIDGEDRHNFLNPLMTNNTKNLGKSPVIFAAFLNAQGRFLFDVFLWEENQILVLDVFKDSAEGLLNHLSRYKLRSKVSLALNNSYALGELSSWPQPFDRAMSNQERILETIPFGVLDVIPEKGVILECGYDLLGALDWESGCYLGQELMSKTKHRGEIRKSLKTVLFEGEVFSGDVIVTSSQEPAGEIRSTDQGCAIAMIRHEFLDEKLFVNGICLTTKNA